ncbi:MAG TPA: hypothetical protein VEL70_01115 [Candidatus Acidoferrum sp.]|nr:hypothetical protein [Candidatus Acidoferrum sp.]
MGYHSLAFIYIFLYLKVFPRKKVQAVVNLSSTVSTARITRRRDVIHQVYSTKPVQTFGYPEAKLLPRASSKQQQQMVLSEVLRLNTYHSLQVKNFL